MHTHTRPVPLAMHSLLIVNPNSTQAITDALEPIISPLLPSNFTATYFTGPPGSPSSINDLETEHQSTEACLPHLEPLLPQHSGVLICCYSAHSLVPELRKRCKAPVIGILEASVHHSLSLLPPGKRFGVVTTGKAWEALLDEAVREVGVNGKAWAGVESTGLNADELHRVGHDELKRRMRGASDRLIARGEVEVMCLGCAGMVGMDEMVKVAGVKIVDPVIAGTLVLKGLVEAGYEKQS